MSVSNEAQQIATAYGYQNTMYAEWLLDPKGPNRPMLEHWDREDLAAYCGGEFVKAKEQAR